MIVLCSRCRFRLHELTLTKVIAAVGRGWRRCKCIVATMFRAFLSLISNLVRLQLAPLPVRFVRRLTIELLGNIVLTLMIRVWATLQVTIWTLFVPAVMALLTAVELWVVRLMLHL